MCNVIVIKLMKILNCFYVVHGANHYRFTPWNKLAKGGGSGTQEMTSFLHVNQKIEQEGRSQNDS